MLQRAYSIARVEGFGAARPLALRARRAAAFWRCGVFCPNCGTQNPDAAQTCSKCNFHLKSVAAPKFKGTMLMMNQPGTVPVAPPAGGQQQQPNTQRTGLPGSTPPPGAAGMPVPNRLKGTMVGVAPMANPGRPINAPVAVPSAGGAPMGGPGIGGPGMGGPGMGGPMGN